VPYELHGWGSDLAIEVSGADVAACCAAAIEGFAASFIDVPAGAARRSVAVTIEADEPAELLAELLEDAIVRLDARGEVVVGLTAGRLQDGALHAELEIVPIADVTLVGAVPKAVTWHDRRLEQTDGGWCGHVVLDL
jgi:SHS2 domain-containing protein